MEYRHCFGSPLGDILMESDGTALTGLWFADSANLCEDAGRKNDSAGCAAPPTTEEGKTVATPLTEEGELVAPTPAGDAGELLPVFRQTEKWLRIYFEGKDPGFLPPVKLEGSAFGKEVWEILRTIPYGRTMSYGEIAKIMAERRGIPRMAAQAVGGAVGKNPVSLIVPCHRVIGTDGSLVGYGGGLDRKKQLLELEMKAAQPERT